MVLIQSQSGQREDPRNHMPEAGIVREAWFGGPWMPPRIKTRAAF